MTMLAKESTQKFHHLIDEIEKPPDQRSDFYYRVLTSRDRKNEHFHELKELRHALIRYAMDTMGTKNGWGSPAKVARSLGLTDPKDVQYVQVCVQAMNRSRDPRRDLALGQELHVALEERELELAANGIAGILQKMDEGATIAYKKIIERIEMDSYHDSKEKPVVSTRDLVAFYKVNLEEIREIMFRSTHKAQASKDPSSLSDAELKKTVIRNAEILEGMDGAPEPDRDPGSPPPGTHGNGSSPKGTHSQKDEASTG